MAVIDLSLSYSLSIVKYRCFKEATNIMGPARSCKTNMQYTLYKNIMN